MRSFAIVSVAMTILAAGAVAANAQQAQDQRHDRYPAASESHQSAPRHANPRTLQPQQRQTTGAGTEEKQDSYAGAAHRDRHGSATSAKENRETIGADERASTAQHGRQPEHSRAAKRSVEQPRATAHDRQTRERAAAPERQRAEHNRPETTGQASPSESNEVLRSRRDDLDHHAHAVSRSRPPAVSLSQRQRTRISARISERIDRIGVRPISRSRIAVRVGAAVPSSVRLYTLPSDVVSIYPRFRGDRFVFVEDEIVIIEPATRRIVAVLPASGARHDARARTETTGSAVRRERLTLSPEERSVIRTTVLREPSCHYEQRLDFFLFMPVPRSVQVCDFPRQVVEEYPEIGSYRYVVHGDDVVVVDPDRDQVVEVIR